MNPKQPDKSAKLPYTAPQVTAYGTVAELTRGSHGSRADNGSLSNPPPVIQH